MKKGVQQSSYQHYVDHLCPNPNHTKSWLATEYILLMKSMISYGSFIFLLNIKQC